MRWPWQKRDNRQVAAPAAPVVDVEAVARAAAEDASKATAEAVLRVIYGSSPMPGIPDANKQHALYAFDNPIVYATPQAPTRRPMSPVTVQTMRQLADNYDVLRSCIQHLKREVAAVPLSIVAKDQKDKLPATAARIKEAEAWFATKGGLGGRGTMRADFEGRIIEDLSVVGAAALYYTNDRKGRPLSVEPVDASTIRPRVDAYGWPGPGEERYEQWILGLKVAGFTAEEMTYQGLPTNSVTYSPYYKSPVEWLIHVVNSALRADQWNRDWLTDGTSVNDTICLPENWTQAEVQSYSAFWDAMLAGDTKGRNKTKFLPAGSSKLGSNTRKDQDFQEFELWLLRRTCALMGVQPASIGFAGEQYKVSQSDSMESTSAFGVGIILAYLDTLYNDILERREYDDLIVTHVSAREEKAEERAKRNQILVSAGIKTPNEARQDEGLDPLPDGDVLIVAGIAQTLDALINPPAPVAAPAPCEKPGAGEDGEEHGDKQAQRAALAQWERKAINRLRNKQSPAARFESAAVAVPVREYIEARLGRCNSAVSVRSVFREAASLDTQDIDERGSWSARFDAELRALTDAPAT